MRLEEGWYALSFDGGKYSVFLVLGVCSRTNIFRSCLCKYM